MDKLRNYIKNYQQQLVLVFGYLIVATIGFGLGQFTTHVQQAPQIRVEEVFNQPAVGPDNYTPNVTGAQTAIQASATTLNCVGKIKGSSSKIYHLPGGAFYDKTTRPVRCFDTEAQALAAGFRKSSR